MALFGLCKMLNDLSVEQETVGMTLEMTTALPNFQPAFWPKKCGSGNKVFGYI